jgi:hypothetical protein
VQAVVDALSLLANIVMACNTAKMQTIFDRRAQRRSGAIPPELITRSPRRAPKISICGVSTVTLGSKNEGPPMRLDNSETAPPTDISALIQFQLAIESKFAEHTVG